jgi:hypothetical protein
VKNVIKSPLKLVICVPDVDGRKEKTALAPLEPLYRFQVCPASEIPDATGFGCPAALNDDEMGPALILASQTMISVVAVPPGEFAVNMS